jgi:hypothetical protein
LDRAVTASMAQNQLRVRPHKWASSEAEKETVARDENVQCSLGRHGMASLLLVV